MFVDAHPETIIIVGIDGVFADFSLVFIICSVREFCFDIVCVHNQHVYNVQRFVEFSKFSLLS